MEMRLILGLHCFLLLVPGSDGAIKISPSSKAVLNGTSRISMSCASDFGYQAVSWKYTPVGGSSAVYIALGSTVFGEQNQSYAIELAGTQQSNLIILSATMARAGTYSCLDITPQQTFAELIIVNSDPVCSMTPNAPEVLLYNQTVQMSCSISYTATASYVTVDMIWSKNGSTDIINLTPHNITTSSTITTAVSTINQTPGNFTPFPIYRCNTTFKITGNLPIGAAKNAPGYSKSTPLFNSPITVIYLKPADATSISGVIDGGQVPQGATVKCNVDANPPASYSWLDIVYGNTTNTSSIQIWHSGEYQCTAWNKAASTSVSVNVTTFTTTTGSTTTRPTSTTSVSNAAITSGTFDASGSDKEGGLSHGAKVGIGVGIGVGGTLVLVGIIFAVLNRRCEWVKRNETDGKLDVLPERATDSSRIHKDNSNVPQYEPLKILSTQNSSAGPTYEHLTTSTNVDVAEHNLHNRPIYENTENTSNENESSSAAYQSLQHREMSPSDAYEAIKTNQ